MIGSIGRRRSRTQKLQVRLLLSMKMTDCVVFFRKTNVNLSHRLGIARIVRTQLSAGWMFCGQSFPCECAVQNQPI